MGFNSACRFSRFGRELNRPSVYGWRVFLKISSRVPCSMTRPAYTTDTSSQISATIPRSWVIINIEVLYLSRRPFIISSTCAWIVTSRAVVGSSAIRSSGLHASAMAMTTRCFIPPENWCGYSPPRLPGIPTNSSISLAFCIGSTSFSWSLMTSAICSSTVMTGSKEVMGSWKIMATFFPRMSCISFSLMERMSWPSSLMLPSTITPGGSGISRNRDRPVVVFPAPVSPTRPRVFPLPISRSRPFNACTTP